MEQKYENNRLLLIGGNLICGTLVNRKLFSGITLVDSLLGCSPFSLACTEERPEANVKGTARKVDLENGLEQYLSSHPADILVVDLHYVCEPLFQCGNSYFTKFSGLSADTYGKEAKEIKVSNMPTEEKKRLIQDFAKILLRYFPGEKIGLIQTIKSKYYAVKNRVRLQEAEKFNSFMGECEQWFQEATNCFVIDTLRFYYMEKKANGMQYEKEAYLDLVDNVKRFTRQVHVRKRPIFRYSLDRYCRYYNNVYKNAFQTFLRKENAIENLVFSSEPWFVQKHFELLRYAEKKLKSSYQDLCAVLDLSMDGAPLLRDILLAMDATMKKKYTNPDIRYDLLFENRITVRSLWQATRKFVNENIEGIYPEQVTEVNYGYYFSIMQLHLTTNDTIRARALKTLERMQADPHVELKPMMLDIWGSCVSRLNFQYDNTAHDCKMVYRSNMFQGLPLFLNGPTVTYDKKMFAPPISFDNKMVQMQLDSGICNYLDASGTDWIVLDFYTLTALTVHDYQGKLYCDNQGVFTKKLKSKKVTLHKQFTNEEIFAELDKLTEYLHGRYGEHIILIKHKRMEHYLDFQGKIHLFPDKELKDSLERNPYNDIYTEYFANTCGCYYIDIVDQFLADEMNMLYLKSVHYEDEFYEEVQKLMRYIVSEQPSKKHFTTYDYDTRVKRIAKMTKHNAGSPVLQTLFHNHWLDEYLLNMDSAIVETNAQVFAELYSESYLSAQEAIRRFRYPGGKTVVAEIAKMIEEKK